jgi:hypothetical protein
VTSAALDKLFEDPARWVDAIPPAQRPLVEYRLQAGESPEDIASAWISGGSRGIWPEEPASEPQTLTLLSAVWREVEGFLCGDSKYADDRSKFQGAWSVTHAGVVSAISVAIAPHVGIATPLITVPVAMLLTSMGKCTLEAWCSQRLTTRSSGL